MNAVWWLLILLLGWLIGWAALRDVRWALLPGVLTVVLIAVQPWDATLGQIRGYEGWPAVGVTLALGTSLLAWVPKLPKRQGRVAASFLGPLLALHVLRLVLDSFLSIIG